MTDEIKILVCTHKDCVLPSDEIYFPIQVGKALSGFDLGIQGDDTGENISEKNKHYCELTAMYWAWKNIKKTYPQIKYIGLCHYRRFFSYEKNKLQKDLIKHKIILSSQFVFPWSLEHHYCIYHLMSDFDILKKIMQQYFFETYYSFNKVINSNYLSPYNMFITEFRIFDEYCSWIFPILFELEKQIDLKTHDKYQERVFGFIAERLLNVFVYYKKLNSKYYPIILSDCTSVKQNTNLEQSCKEKLKNNLIFYCIKKINRLFDCLPAF